MPAYLAAILKPIKHAEFQNLLSTIGVRNKMLQPKIVGFKQGINYLLYIATVTLENPLVYCCALSKNTFVLFRNII